MAFTDGDLAYLRTRLGTTLDEDDLDDRMARLDSLPKVALEVLQERYATLLTKPLSFTVPGDYSEDRSKNLAAIQAMIDLVSNEAGVVPAGALAIAVRPRRNRWRR